MPWLNKLGFADPYGTTSHAVNALFKGGTRDLGNGLRVVRVGSGDDRLLSAVIDCLTRGECGTTTSAPDPLLDWVYKPREAKDVYKPLTTPPSPHRLKWFRWLMSYSAYFAQARNGLYALVDATRPQQVMAAAVTGPPSTIPYGRMSGGEMGDWCQKAGMEMAIEVLANNMRNRVLGTWQGQAHGGENHKHLEIIIIATAPEYQGRGVGTALLRFLGEVADADGVPTHLETAGARNTGFYAQKGSYQVVHRSPVASFNHEGGGVAMQRRPGARTGYLQETKERQRSRGNEKDTQRIEDHSVGTEKKAINNGKSVGPAGCLRFQPKRKRGPLASYCINCNEHKSRCTAMKHEIS